MIQIRKANNTYYFTRIDFTGSRSEELPMPAEHITAWQIIEEALNSAKTTEDKVLELIMLKATDDEKLGILNFYPDYMAGTAYAIGDEFKYLGDLYRVIQAHTAQADWVPTITPALYKKIVPAGVIPVFVQPTGAHDAYNIGDKVMFSGVVYESVINANTWSPASYPAGWKLV